jgi:uncharacterized protein DUF4390
MHCSRRRADPLALLLGVLALAGCSVAAQQPGTLAIRAVQVHAAAAGSVLDLALDTRLSGPMQDALEHGIPITLRIDVEAGRWPHAQSASRRIELRYFPLSQRYQLRREGSDEVRSFAAPAYLLAALGALRIELPAGFAQAGAPIAVGVGVDHAALPGALRLPALFEPAWQLAANASATAAAP